MGLVHITRRVIFFGLLLCLLAFISPLHYLKGGGGRRSAQQGAASVVTQFKQQLDRLIKIVEKTEVHYIRCVKPNQIKSSALFKSDVVSDQLKCGGVYSAVEVTNSMEAL